MAMALKLFKTETIKTDVLRSNGLREFRLKHGVSLRALANESGINHSYLYKIEQGQRTPSREMASRIEAAMRSLA